MPLGPVFGADHLLPELGIIIQRLVHGNDNDIRLLHGGYYVPKKKVAVVMVLTAPFHSRMGGRFKFYGMVGEIIMVVNVQKRVKKE